ncbi:MAG: hypothetical protein CMH63_02370 [Nanoarchaeota archaeon]|nr:hypothetical protein [Nanoarchaeota archaeon]|tara:strand:- start:3510 stop:3887 length:378 start_codon:yes stop_codon:yes gene_type:complete
MAKRKRTEEKPLSEIIEGRRNYYKAQMTKAFEAVYASGDFGHIERFEQVVLRISEGAVSGKLEGLVSQQKRKPKGDRRPRLTAHQYNKSRDEGMSNEEIKAKFRIDPSYQLGGFARQYNRRQAEK